MSRIILCTLDGNDQNLVENRFHLQFLARSQAVYTY